MVSCISQVLTSDDTYRCPLRGRRVPDRENSQPFGCLHTHTSCRVSAFGHCFGKPLLLHNWHDLTARIVRASHTRMCASLFSCPPICFRQNWHCCGFVIINSCPRQPRATTTQTVNSSPQMSLYCRSHVSLSHSHGLFSISPPYVIGVLDEYTRHPFPQRGAKNYCSRALPIVSMNAILLS